MKKNEKGLDIYIVTRMSENKSDVPNLGVFLDYKSAEHHFNDVLEDRKGDKTVYKCKILWVNDYKLSPEDYQGCIKDAYILHPKTKHQEEYRESLRIEWWFKPKGQIVLDRLMNL